MRRTIPVVVLGLALAIAAACGSSPAAPTTPPQTPAPQPTPDPPNPQPPAPIVIPQIRLTKFLTFGDSNTEGESTPASHNPATPGVERGYPYKLQTLLSARYTAQTVSVFNGGVSGERPTSAAVQQRLVDLLNQLRPDVLILMHGVNDLNSQVPIAEVVGAIEALLGEARRRNLPAIVLTLPPQRAGAEKAFAAARIQPFNQALARMAVDEGAVVLDIHAVFPVELLAPDGLHITQAGNQLIAETVFAKLQDLYEIK